MKPRPLTELRFMPKYHASALYWVGQLYRRPAIVDAIASQLRTVELARIAAVIFLHTILWPFLFALVLRFFLFACFDTKAFFSRSDSEPTWPFLYHTFDAFASIFITVINGAIVGVALGYLLGAIGKRLVRPAVGLSRLFARMFDEGMENSILGVVGGLPAGILIAIAVQGTALWFVQYATTVLAVVIHGIAFVCSCIALEQPSLNVKKVILLTLVFSVALVGTALTAVGLCSTIAAGCFGMLSMGMAASIALGILHRRPATHIESGVYGTSLISLFYCYVVFLTYKLPSGQQNYLILLGFSITVLPAIGLIAGLGILRRGYNPLFVMPCFRALLAMRGLPWRYDFHPAVWDDMCGYRSESLGDELVALHELDPIRGQLEIERFDKQYPLQRDAAQFARLMIIAKRAEMLTSLNELPRLYEDVQIDIEGLDELKKLLAEISLQQQELENESNPLSRLPNARLLREKVVSIGRWLESIHGNWWWNLSAAQQSWLRLAEEQVQEASNVILKNGARSAFSAGRPIDRNREAFVARIDVVDKLNQQLSKTSCPGIVLYGRRRVGKSTFLFNASRFLPSSVVVVNVSMQDPNFSTSQSFFLNSLCSAVINAFPTLSMNPSSECQLPEFMDFLSRTNFELSSKGKRVLIAIDEYENIDKKLGDGLFSEDLLSTFRESVQKHRNVNLSLPPSFDRYWGKIRCSSTVANTVCLPLL